MKTISKIFILAAVAGLFAACNDNDDIVPDTDLWALQNNYASLVPTCFDWTAHSQIELMKEFENITIDARLRDTRRETMDSPVSRSPVSHVK